MTRSACAPSPRVKRARERERQKQLALLSEGQKVFRDVVVPETITVQELANRMAERSAAVVKTLMNMGVMATATQSIDADTAELVGGRVRPQHEAGVGGRCRDRFDRRGG